MKKHRFVITFAVEAEYPETVVDALALEEVEAAVTDLVDTAIEQNGGSFSSNGIKLSDFVNFTADME